MFRSLIGAAIGSRLAKRYPVLGGATGAVAVRAVPFVLRRISLPAMLAMGAGGYLAKRYYDGRDEGEPGTKARPTDGPDSDTGTVIDNPPGGAIEKTNGRSPAVN
jgi:hypothetical protein